MILKTYRSVYDEIDELAIPIKNKLIALLLSMLVAILICAGPIVFFINMLIFNNYVSLFAFLIATMGIVVIFLTDFMYLHTITEKKISGLYHIWAIDTAIASVIVYLVFMILCMIGVF